jgi:hypothetical protein
MKRKKKVEIKGGKEIERKEEEGRGRDRRRER